MSLYKRGGVWWSYFYFDGRRHSETTGTGNRRQAEKIEQKIKDAANASRFGLDEFDPTVKVGGLTARFLVQNEPSLYHIERSRVFLPFFADVPASRITKSKTEEYRRWRRSRDGVSDATVNRDLSVLRRVLYWSWTSACCPRILFLD